MDSTSITNTLRSQASNLPDIAGVYLFRGIRNKVLYVGKSVDIKARIKSHFSSGNPKMKKMLQLARKIDYIPVASELEALLLEAKLIKRYMPAYNSVAKDDKHPLYIKITKEELPKITTSRRESGTAYYFGPFPSSSTVRQVLQQIRKVFPYCSQRNSVRRGCFYSHLGLCNPCPAEIRMVKDRLRREKLCRDYKQNIRRILMLLSGKTAILHKRLEREMKRLAKQEKFEDAARIRDNIFRLEYITKPYNDIQAYLENPNLLDDIRMAEVKSLHKILKKYIPGLPILQRIEAFDVAHIGGSAAACSLVTFINGEAEKSLYRRFKIKTSASRDDFAMLSEAVRRRLRHLKDWGAPDLMVIDGGKGQVSAVQTVLRDAKLKIPVIGLAKRHEDIVIPLSRSVLGYKFKILRLGADSHANHLLQRLRDEAHRFARSYHFKLRMLEMVR